MQALVHLLGLATILVLFGAVAFRWSLEWVRLVTSIAQRHASVSEFKQSRRA